MSPSPPSQTAPSVYVLSAISASTEELKRLDRVHLCMSEYFDQRIGFAPLENTSPKAILDLGAGSGAWVIDAATKFPTATVFAVDVAPEPSRPFPDNVRFKRADITQPFPFENASFDVIHVRWVLMHLPNVREIIERIFLLLKPGGWLIIEESNSVDMRAAGNVQLPPASAAVIRFWISTMGGRDCDPTIARDLATLAESSGYFDTLDLRKIEVPLAETSRNPKENKLGRLFNETTKEALTKMRDHGILSEIPQGTFDKFLEEMDDKDVNLTMDAYFLSARRRS